MSCLSSRTVLSVEMAIWSLSSLGPGNLSQFLIMTRKGVHTFDIYRDLLWVSFICHGGQDEGTGYLRLLCKAFSMKSADRDRVHAQLRCI